MKKRKPQNLLSQISRWHRTQFLSVFFFCELNFQLKCKNKNLQTTVQQKGYHILTTELNVDGRCQVSETAGPINKIKAVKKT